MRNDEEFLDFTVATEQGKMRISNMSYDRSVRLLALMLEKTGVREDLLEEWGGN